MARLHPHRGSLIRTHIDRSRKWRLIVLLLLRCGLLLLLLLLIGILLLLLISRRASRGIASMRIGALRHLILTIGGIYWLLRGIASILIGSLALFAICITHWVHKSFRSIYQLDDEKTIKTRIDLYHSYLYLRA